MLLYEFDLQSCFNNFKQGKITYILNVVNCVINLYLYFMSMLCHATYVRFYI